MHGSMQGTLTSHYLTPKNWILFAVNKGTVMLYSVVMLSYNSERSILKSLESLKESFTKLNCLNESEIIIVENGSSDSSPKIVNDFCCENEGLAKAILFYENKGTTQSRNAALKVAKGKYILVLDSDAYMTSEALNTLKRALDSNERLGMAVPKLFYGDGRFQMSTDTFPTLKRKFQRFFNLNKMQSKKNANPTFDRYVDYAISACWLLKREAVDAVGGFDEKIFYSPEDVDYCINVWASGFNIKYIANAEVVHDAQELSRGFKISFFHVSHLLGLFYLFKKHGYFLSLDGLYKRIGRLS